MAVIKTGIVRLLVILGFVGMAGATAWAQPAGNAANAISYREFLQSLTPAERKIPINLVAAARYANGQPLPASLDESAALQAREGQPQPEVYRLDGVSKEALLAALAAEGLPPKFVSETRNYVTAVLTPSAVGSLAAYDAVLKISVVVGPTAQGQGSTEAAAAHRLVDLYPLDKPEAGDPALDGSGVVIGVISLPFTQVDLEALEAETTRLIPSASALHFRTGAVDNDNGSLDALYLLQVIYDMAPGAQVVLASPGVNSTPGEMASVVSALVAGDPDAAIPAANIIVDDLFYADQNPFEIDEIAEAVIAARNENVLYITAAGDNGQNGAAPTSTVYLADFDGIEAPSALVQIDPFLNGYYVQSFGGDGFISVSEDLDNLCVFWSERPSPGLIPRFVAWVYDDNNKVVGDIGLSAPGGCAGTPVLAGYKVVFDQGASAVSNYRLMVTGVRSVVPTTLRFQGPIFDTVTSGSIRGHAASADALTVAASVLCDDGETVSYSNCSSLAVASYSSDGEQAGTARFFWESDGSGGFTEISGGLAVSKPNLTAAGQSILKTVSSGTTDDANFYGTSASAAVSAGVAGLYWQYARDTLNIRTAFVDDMTAYLLQRSLLNVGDPGSDTLSGFGVIDAPKPVELGIGTPGAPAPLLRLAMTAKSAGASMAFQALLSADSGATYEATCTESGEAISGWTDKGVEPDRSYAVQATPESVVRCTVTGSVSDGDGGTVTASDTETVIVKAVAETSVSFAAGVDEISVVWSTDTDIADEGMLVVTLTCTNTITGVTVVDNVELDESPYLVEAEDGEALDCSVSTSLLVNGGAATAVGDPATATVTPDMASGLPIWLLYQATQ